MKKVTDVFGIDDLLLGEIAYRGFTGKPLVEHLGATKSFLHFDQLMFLPNQLYQFMLSDEVEVCTRTVLGPNAKKPLEIETPMMITGMTYGVLSKQAKLALAKASAMAGTSANSGEGGMHQEERELAKRYVLQYNRGQFSNEEENIKQADLIEIKWAQGSNPGVPSVLPAQEMDEELRSIRKLAPGQDSYMPAHHPDIQSIEDLKRVVTELREISGGVPIALKFCASRIKEDIDVALEAGVDVIVLDSAQGGTGASLLLTENNFGVPTLQATAIAAQHLREKGVLNQVSLVMAGGFRTPGDVMKALALGADAVYMGTVFLLAMTLPQNQERVHLKEAIQMVHYNIPESQLFDLEKGAQSLANYIKACTEEMKKGCRLLGVEDIHHLDKKHLYSLSEEVKAITGIPTLLEC